MVNNFVKRHLIRKRKISRWLVVLSIAILGFIILIIYEANLREKSLLLAQKVCLSIKPGMQLSEIQAIADKLGGKITGVSESGAIARAPGFGMCRCWVHLEKKTVVAVGEAWCQH